MYGTCIKVVSREINKVSTSSKLTKVAQQNLDNRVEGVSSWLKEFEMICRWSYSTCYLQATECATFLQLTSHSLSLKKPITDCIHSFRITDNPWSWRSKKIWIITASKSAASDAENIVLTLLQMHKGSAKVKRCN